MAGAERVIEVLDTPETIIDNPGAVDIEGREGHIRFENVGFSYEEGTPYLRTSLLRSNRPDGGACGSDRSQQDHDDPACRQVYDPASGRIMLDGVDLRDIKIDSLRSHISPVLQDTFCSTARLPKTYLMPAPMPLEEIIEAAKIARVHDEIMEMPGSTGRMLASAE